MPAPVAMPAEKTSMYDRFFWIAYLANILLVTGNTLTFRFADWVDFLGGTAYLSGVIISLGTVGALMARFLLVHLIEKHGVRAQWMLSSIMFSLGILGMVSVSEPGITLYLSRLCYAIGVAGMFTCSVIHIQQRAPVHRRTEIIGVLGSSGFLGMFLGGIVGDLIFKSLPKGVSQFYYLFCIASSMGLFYLALVVYITWNESKPVTQKHLSIWKAVRKYSPWEVLLVASFMGLGFAVIFVFLTRYATEQGYQLGNFFALYSCSAFSFRLMTKNWNRLIGRHQMITRGLIAHAIGHLTLVFATQEWHFYIPAFFCGFGHALLFPAVISLVSGAFPQEFRGTGTTMAMGFIEIGQLSFSPVIGFLIDNLGFTSMFFISTIAHVSVLALYLICTWKKIDPTIFD